MSTEAISPINAPVSSSASKSSTKTRAIAYWVFTGLVVFNLISGSYVYLTQAGYAKDFLVQLGYPPYLMLIIGAWKLAAAIVILAPRFPVLKEWAYAGFFIDLTSASASSWFSHQETKHVLVPLAVCVLLMASWALRPPQRRVTRPSRP